MLGMGGKPRPQTWLGDEKQLARRRKDTAVVDGSSYPLVNVQNILENLPILKGYINELNNLQMAEFSIANCKRLPGRVPIISPYGGFQLGKWGCPARSLDGLVQGKSNL